MKYLSEKNILLISPQPWDHIFISKHHYAEELIKNNNTVYFMEPPSEGKANGIHIRKHESLDGLFIISWKVFFPRAIRFHLYTLYVFLISIQARKIKKKIGGKIDLVWSFDFNLFPNLRAFGASLSIFHPVDPLNSKKQVNIGQSADIILSVSEKILRNFNAQEFSKKTLLVNHGLCREFSKLSFSKVKYVRNKSKVINVGYFGNLNREMINLEVWLKIIENNSAVNFHFWGPYEIGGEFSMALRKFKNVFLYGRKNKLELAAEISDMDCFMLIYSKNPVDSDRSNSHKILEYLATGKVIFSSRIEAYSSDCDLIIMPPNGSDDEIPKLFDDALKKMDKLNSEKLMQKRKDLSKCFTYGANLEKIDNFILDHCCPVNFHSKTN